MHFFVIFPIEYLTNTIGYLAPTVLLFPSLIGYPDPSIRGGDLPILNEMAHCMLTSILVDMDEEQMEQSNKFSSSSHTGGAKMHINHTTLKCNFSLK